MLSVGDAVIKMMLWSKLRAYAPPTLSAWMWRAEILNHDFQKHPPVLIYQFGKVGSSTLRESLRRSPLQRPVYQVHRLSKEGIGNYQEKYVKFPNSRDLADCLAIAQTLRVKLDLEKRHTTDANVPKISVITITRDPIAAMLSSFFQTLDNKRANQFRRIDGTLDVDLILKVIHRQFKKFDESTNRICTWFDRELHTTLGIDVFAYPFDPNQGYQVIQTSTVDVLLLRLEDLNRIGAQVISEFLGLPTPLELRSYNQRDRQGMSETYEYVKANLNLPKAVCRKIYRSRYASHFYSKPEQKAFIQKWGAENRMKRKTLDGDSVVSTVL